MAQLVLRYAGFERIFDLDPRASVVLGRARDCDLQLDDPSLSRRHCELRRDGRRWLARDLGSSNGTFRNDEPITEHALDHGDRIKLGICEVQFLLSEDERTLPLPSDALHRKLRNLEALFDITRAVSSELGVDRLLELLVRKAIDLCHAERGFLVLRDGSETVFRVARDRAGANLAEPERKTSRKIIARVLESGRPVQTLDAQNDLAGVSQTLANLEVRSLLCAALRVKGEVLGCVYVDSQLVEQEFGDEALELLQSFADQAAIALHNARLFEEARLSREQEMRVRQIFQKYVPADVVRQALEIADPAQLSAKQTATVLFSDIRGFTTLAEQLAPEAVVGLLNDYLRRMVAIVYDEGGIVDKFMGDAVMALFGAPLAKPDDAERAVRAGQRMLRELDLFNREQLANGGTQLRIGIGIHTGPVIAGNIGSDRKMEYTVIGDTVNIASRVQDLNKTFGTELLVTQAVLDATDGRVATRALGPVQVKGKSTSLQIFEVLAASAGQRQPPPPPPGRAPSRLRELAQTISSAEAALLRPTTDDEFNAPEDI